MVSNCILPTNTFQLTFYFAAVIKALKYILRKQVAR